MKSFLYADIVHYPTPKVGDIVHIFLKERYGVNAEKREVLLDRNTWVQAEVYAVKEDGTLRVVHTDWNVPMRNTGKIIRSVKLSEIRIF